MNQIHDTATGIDPSLYDLIANHSYQRAATYAYALLSELNVPLNLVSDHKMTSSNGHIIRATGPLCGEFTGHRWIHHIKPVTRSFGVFFHLRLNKQLSKQSLG